MHAPIRLTQGWACVHPSPPPSLVGCLDCLCPDSSNEQCSDCTLEQTLAAGMHVTAHLSICTECIAPQFCVVAQSRLYELEVMRLHLQGELCGVDM